MGDVRSGRSRAGETAARREQPRNRKIGTCRHPLEDSAPSVRKICGYGNFLRKLHSHGKTPESRCYCSPQWRHRDP